MERDPRDAGLLDEALRELHAARLAGRDPERSFTVTGRPLPSSRPRARSRPPCRDRRAGRRPRRSCSTLRHRAAHVEVDQVGAGRGAARRPIAITSGSWPKSCIATGCSSGGSAGTRARALVAVLDAEARDHLGDRQPGAMALCLQAHEPVADPGERREHERGSASSIPPRVQGSVERARRTATTGYSRCVPRSAAGRSRVSRSSTSSICSQNGAIALGEAARWRSSSPPRQAPRAGATRSRPPVRRSRRRPRTGWPPEWSCRSRAPAARGRPGTAGRRDGRARRARSRRPGEITPPRYSPRPRRRRS